VCAQEAEISTAQDMAHGLLLQAQAVRQAVVEAGAGYRALFAWLLALCRRIGEESPSAAARPLPFQQDPLAMATFLSCQFARDAIGPHLAQEVRPHRRTSEPDEVQKGMSSMERRRF
jgi:hypothetical protein